MDRRGEISSKVEYMQAHAAGSEEILPVNVLQPQSMREVYTFVLHMGQKKTLHFPPKNTPLSSLRRRDRTEGEERSEAVLSADHRQQMPLGGADHPHGGLLGRGPRREARLRPHQDLRGQTQQVRLVLCFFSLPV